MSNNGHRPATSREPRKNEIVMWADPFSSKSQMYSKVVTFIFLAIVIFLLLTEHRAHLYIALPWVLLIGLVLLFFITRSKRRGNKNNHNKMNKEKSNDYDGDT